MSFLANIVSVLTADIRTTVFTIIIAFIAYKLSKFYVKVYNLPPGPIPLPFLGNLLYFRGTKEHWSLELEKAGDKYGPVFTMWLGAIPVIFISDIDLAREAFRKNDFAGRPEGVLRDMLTRGDNTDIVMADYGHQWEALRRVAHSAIQKYSTTDKLVYLVSDCVDHTIKTMVEKEGIDKPFDPSEYIFNTFLNILANSAFGIRYEMDDPEYKAVKYVHKDFFDGVQMRFVFWEMFPLFRKYDKVHTKMLKIMDEHLELLKGKFQCHYKDYSESVIRDFCDTLITAKNDALREGKESAPYLNDTNLALVLFDLFLAGTSTSQMTFRWIVLFITYYPEVQKKLRQEIESEIGDRIPTHEDRDRCHYVNAVISEALRLRNIIPNGVNHKAVVTSKIGYHTIPEGTQISVFQGHILHKEEYWSNAKEFEPERFLEDGKYITTRQKAFIPFSIGRRVCPGERMAQADLFLALVRLLQSTSDYNLVLHYNGGDTEPDPNKTDFFPKDYKISLKKK